MQKRIGSSYGNWIPCSAAICLIFSKRLKVPLASPFDLASIKSCLIIPLSTSQSAWKKMQSRHKICRIRNKNLSCQQLTSSSMYFTASSISLKFMKFLIRYTKLSTLTALHFRKWYSASPAFLSLKCFWRVTLRSVLFLFSLILC